MIRVKEVIVVEGRYDKNRLSALVDGVIIETEGFGLFRNKEKLELLRRLAKERGLVVLTDSDGAGFLIRGKIASCIPPEQVKHAYIPDFYGKERRKAKPSKEGKLGVEGMSLNILRRALEQAGAALEEETGPQKASAPRQTPTEQITKADLFQLGLSGQTDSAEKRRELQRALGLPERLSANGLLQVLNALYSREEFYQLAGSPAENRKKGRLP